MRAIALLVALCGIAQATTYFATASGANINAASLWVPTSTGTCTGSGTAVALSALVDGDILNTNGCAAATVMNVDPCPSCSAGQAVKLTTGSAGLGFTLSAATLAGATWHFGALGAFASAVVVSGSGSGTVNSGTQGFTGGTTANATGITDSHTTGTITYVGNALSGSAVSTNGILNNGSATTIVINGNCTAGFATGCQAAFSGTTTVNGNCTGSDSQFVFGCNNAGVTLGTWTVNGNLIHGLKGPAAQGIKFNPSATNYVCGPKDSSYVAFTGSNAATAEDCTHTGGGVGLSSHAIEIPIDPGAANVKAGTNYGTFTGTLAGGGITAAFGGWH